MAERKHRHILEVTRAIRFSSRNSNQVLGKLYSDCYISHKQATKYSNWNKTPYERLYHRKPSYNHLKVLEYMCYAKIVQQYDKIMARTKAVVHIGYVELWKWLCVVWYSRENVLCK